MKGSNPWELAVVGNTLYFGANNGDNGQELWKSDGTKDGTVMVKDINPIGSSYPRKIIAVGHTLYFTIDGVSGKELWKSDGTEDGTKMVKDISDIIGGKTRYDLITIGNTLYYGGYVNSVGELWTIREGKVMCSVNE